MKLYKLIRTIADHDEYDGFIIWANSKEEAIKLAVDKAGYYAYECIAIEVTEPEQPKIILSSFIAG
ncbi:hypothetical protein [Orbus mooreae]|uniref:hypothetical protein n=1 Tax=Orbus mooreae TaxID=3074107 RepID=UPI00370D48D4